MTWAGARRGSLLVRVRGDLECPEFLSRMWRGDPRDSPSARRGGAAGVRSWVSSLGVERESDEGSRLSRTYVAGAELHFEQGRDCPGPVG